jgi:hypothetical protein
MLKAVKVTLIVLFLATTYSFAFSWSNINDRIVEIAESFLGTPYDPDPLGAYVRKKVIVYDEKVDCLYLVFRVIELAIATNESHSIEIALEKRFKTRGIISNGIVINYEDRYEYAEDIIPTGKFGNDITRLLSDKIAVTSSFRVPKFEFIPKSEICKVEKKLRNGDIVFFVKNPNKRNVDEIIGHLGIVKIEGSKAFLIHAKGHKVKNYENAENVGKVTKEPLCKYLMRSNFLGIKVTRL